MELLLKIFFILLCIISIGGCSSFGGPDIGFSNATFGVEDTATGKLLKGCKPVPERNVQRCVLVKNNQTIFFERPLATPKLE